MEIITTVQAAKMIGVTAQTIRNWIDRGIIKSKIVGHIYYVEKDFFENFEELHNDIPQVMESLIKERDAYLKEAEMYRSMRNDIRYERDRTKYLYLMINSGVRNSFFQCITEILTLTDVLTDREADIIHMALKGDSYSSIAETYGLSRERMRQIIDKAIRKSIELKTLKETVLKIDSMQREIEQLKSENKLLKSYIPKNEKEDNNDEQITVYDKIVQILRSKPIEYDLTVRALNCLKAADVETIGDLVKYNRFDLLRFRNFGKKTLTELDELVESLGLMWGMDVDKYYLEKALRDEEGKE